MHGMVSPGVVPTSRDPRYFSATRAVRAVNRPLEGDNRHWQDEGRALTPSAIGASTPRSAVVRRNLNR